MCPSSQGAARVQSLWVQPVPQERVRGVPVAVEGLESWTVLGSRVRGPFPRRIPNDGFGPNQEVATGTGWA